MVAKPPFNLPDATKLWLINALHTVVWAFFVAAILFVLFCGITNNITVHTWIASSSVVVEGLILLAFKSPAPLRCWPESIQP